MDERDWIAMDHLDRMTDSTGLIQHAIYGVPRRDSGYTTDDNARALRLCTRLWRRRPDERLLKRGTGYLGVLGVGRPPGGGVPNFMNDPRPWLGAGSCGDCQAPA